MNKILSLVAATVIVASFSGAAHAKSVYNVNRLYGVDRYKTSVSISNYFNNDKVQSVIISSGRDFPDALTGSVLSKKYNAPILLFNNTIIESTDSINYITSHLDKNGTIYVLGGNGSISEDFTTYMKKLGYNNILRLGGTNRADTNKSIVNSINVEKKTPIIITNGYDGFADGLSISSIAAAKGYPIFITKNTNLPDEIKSTISSIEPSQVYIIGGTGVVKDQVITELKSLVPTLDDSNITRISGDNRYETSLGIAEYFNQDTSTAIIANGTNFPDALSGSSLAAKLNAPIILTNGKDIEEQRSLIDSKSYSDIILLGGIASVDFPIEYSFKDPQKITQEEKDYINTLINSCDELLSKTYAISSGLSDFIVAINTIEDVMNKNASDPGSAIEAISPYFTDTFDDTFSNLANLGGHVSILKNEALKLQSPEGLESLKLDYAKSAEIDSKNIDNVTGYYYDYVSALSSLTRSSQNDLPVIFPKGSDSYKKMIKSLIENVSKNTNNVIHSSQYVGNEREKIQQLKERLEKAKQYMN